MKRALVLLFAACFVMGMASVAMAGITNKQAAIAVHVGPAKAGSCKSTAPSLTGATVNTTGLPLTAYNLYFLVCNGSDSLGVAGMEFGISYGPNLFLSNTSVCSDLDFRQGNAASQPWPASGTGILFTWNGSTNCQRTNSEPFVPGTVIAIGGSVSAYAYGPDQLSITPGPVSLQAKVAACNAAETVVSGKFPSHLGTAGFGQPGYNPCNAPTPVESTTWGKIKSQYGK